MSAAETVQPTHLRRLAVVYVRQSSPHQPLTNQESLKLQYALQGHARDAGWDPTQVRVIDTDLGCSARTSQGRAGFQELVTLVTLERVGIIFAYDVTRLARNCTDWYQLLDLCGYRQCLVGDQDGIYDPATPNGRLILGLKGLISELELHTIRARLTAGLLNKAARGELALALPVGLVRDPSGTVTKHPNREVQSRIDLLFATFLRVKSISQVVAFCNEQELQSLDVPVSLLRLAVDVEGVSQLLVEQGDDLFADLGVDIDPSGEQTRLGHDELLRVIRNYLRTCPCDRSLHVRSRKGQKQARLT
jgi:DNA invertase Pin-like site-specific DNA recombinase